MVEDILRYVHSQEGTLSAVRLEDVAVCKAYYDSLADAGQQSAHADLPDLVERWIALEEGTPAVTFGRRQQVLLRVLVDLLERRGVAQLSRDEADFLLAAYDLARRKAGMGRVRELLDSHYGEVVQRCEKLRPSPGLMLLGTRVRVVSPERLEKSSRRHVEMFAGQPRSASIPTLEVSGPVRILGSIPDECAVLVTAGSCSVDGYVLGRLSVVGDCDVRENIGGCVVAGAGDIYCRNIIEKATVVAKMGSIRMIQAMGPTLLFAADAIEASESISRGKYFSPRIVVQKKVRGGEIHVAHSLVANQLEPAEGAPLHIVLRTQLTCEDYGEQVGPEVARLKARAAHLRRQLSHLANMVRSTQAEAEHAASTTVLQIFSDTHLMTVIEERAQVARRLAVLNRLISVMHELYSGAEESLSLTGAAGGDDSPHLMFSEMEADLDELAREGSVDQDLNQQRQEIKQLYDHLGWTRNDHSAMLGMMSQLRERIEPWVEERRAVMAKLERLTHEVSKAVPEADLDALAQAAQAAREPKLAALQRRIMTLKKNPPNDEIRRRFQIPLVLRMVNVMQRRIYRLNELGASIIRCKTEQAAVAEELRSQYLIGESQEEAAPARVSGRFAAGVRIYRDTYLLQEDNALPGAVLVTSATDAVMTYMRGLASIVPCPNPAQAETPSR